jgi:D-erythro-7,8-dihydroneopterin triphosphate epimerase
LVQIRNISFMAKIKVKNLLLRTYIGFNPDEQVNRQDVVINFEIETDVSHKALAEDDPDDILDYKSITKKVIQLVQEGKFNLLEVLTQKILDLIMENKKVRRAKVEVDKPHALRFAESVSIEMEAENNSGYDAGR